MSFKNSETKTKEDILSAYNEIIGYMRTIAKKVADELRDSHCHEKYTIQINGSRGNRNHAGLINQHIGISFNMGRKTAYYISFTSLNIDDSSYNVHEAIGRVQFMIAHENKDAGCPNEKLKCKAGDNCYVIHYPIMSEDKSGSNDLLLIKAQGEDERIYDWDNFFKGKEIRRIYQTGYKLFGEASGDAKEDRFLEDEDSIDEFCTMIVSLINYLDSRNKTNL
ncbi:MAG: hypothetical protein E7242_08700 [Lachnospiraceae bacterium]|nr:hypothetical protein [Lachnospiraceae bacterium]